MPVAAVFENLEDGLTIDEVVKLFDGLRHEPSWTSPPKASRRLHSSVNAHSVRSGHAGRYSSRPAGSRRKDCDVVRMEHVAQW